MREIHETNLSHHGKRAGIRRPGDSVDLIVLEEPFPETPRSIIREMLMVELGRVIIPLASQCSPLCHDLSSSVRVSVSTPTGCLIPERTAALSMPNRPASLCDA